MARFRNEQLLPTIERNHQMVEDMATMTPRVEAMREQLRVPGRGPTGASKMVNPQVDSAYNPAAFSLLH